MHIIDNPLSILQKPEDRKKAIAFGYGLCLISILALFSIVTTSSAIKTYEISIEGSKNLLENRVLDIAINLAITIEKVGIEQSVFNDIVQAHNNSDIAFLTLYAPDSTVLLHTNASLVGRKQPDQLIQKIASENRYLVYNSNLGTGENVFLVDFPVHIKAGQCLDSPPDVNSSSASIPFNFCADRDMFGVLRVAVHTYHAEKLVRKARFQIVMTMTAQAILWGFVLAFFVFYRRNEYLAQKLRQQERMAMLGEMSAVLAHEIRNPLSSIKGFAQYHLQTKGQNHGIAEDLEIIVTESERLERLTTDLLAYARPDRLMPRETDLNRLITTISKGIGTPPHGILLKSSCTDSLITIDAEKVIQIAINLIQNAFDAIVEMQSVQGRNNEEGQVCLSIELQDATLFIIVTDNGSGIPEEIQSKLHEPFITTKTRGTGLGLAIVKRLVDALGGSIKFHANKPRGTIATVKLPVE